MGRASGPFLKKEGEEKEMIGPKAGKEQEGSESQKQPVEDAQTTNGINEVRTSLLNRASRGAKCKDLTCPLEKKKKKKIKNGYYEGNHGRLLETC